MAKRNGKPSGQYVDDQYAAVNKGRKWTVMVFMSADGVGGDFPLSQPAKDDIEEMALRGCTPTLDLFVQVHGVDNELPRRRRIQKGDTWNAIIDDSSTIVPESEREMEGGLALKQFIIACLKQSRPFEPTRTQPDDSGKASEETQYTMLVLWGHAYDFGVARVLTASGSPDALDYSELSKLLDGMQSDLQTYFELDVAPRLDVIGFDACDAATLELAYELAPYAKFLLGSQVGIPIPGWPYDRVLERLAHPLQRLISPGEFGLWAVNRFVESYSPDRPASLSFLSLDRAVAVAARAAILADMINGELDGDPSLDSSLARILAQSITIVGKPYIDVADFCCNLVREDISSRVTIAATMFGNSLIDYQRPVVKHSEESGVRPFVAARGRNAGILSKLNGVSLYAPFDMDADHRLIVRSTYESMQFARKTRWSELAHRLASA